MNNKLLAVFVVIGALILAGGASFFINQNTNRVDATEERAEIAKKRADDIRAALLKACYDSTKPGGVRYVIAEQLREENRSAHNTSPRLFPDIPAEEFKRLIAEGNRKRSKAIRQLLDAGCDARYR
jgi:type II secretory pathway pseudopilin PulG